MDDIDKLSNIGGVWSKPWYPALYWGGGLPLMRLELIADDHSYSQYKTTEQKYNPACQLPYI